MQLEIGTDPLEVGRARRWARSRLAGAGVGAEGQLAETLVLLISELVTNAVVHTGCPAVLRMLVPARQARGAVRVEVADASAMPPRQRQAEGDDTNGRGLELVSGLADRWGWQRVQGGKLIWCELDHVEPGAGEGDDAGASTGAEIGAAGEGAVHGVGAGLGAGFGSGFGAGLGSALGSGVGLGADSGVENAVESRQMTAYAPPYATTIRA